MTSCNTPKRAITRARELLGFSQSEFAKKFDLSLSSVRFREYGIRTVPESLATRLSAEFGFHLQTLLANKPGPCLMFDGTVASTQSMEGWKKMKVHKHSVEKLAARASQIAEQLVYYTARRGNAFYRDLLADFSTLTTRHGKDGAIGKSTTESITCPLNELSEKNAALWSIISTSKEYKLLNRKVHPSATVTVKWRVSDVMKPLICFDEHESHVFIDEILAAKMHQIDILNCGKKIMTIKASRFQMSSVGDNPRK